MKILLLTTLLIGLIMGCSQYTEEKSDSVNYDTKSSQKVETKEKVNKELPKDTLTIVDSEFTIDPFDFGEDPLKRLTSIESASTNYKTYKNRHVDNQIDTSFQVIINVDTFKVYKTASENWLTAANIYSDRFSTRQGIRIGMTKSDIKEQLKSKENFPDFVRLQNLKVLEWIDLKFKDEKLDKIEFKGYMD